MVFVTYGSVNLAWAMRREHKQDDYKAFYESLKSSGATLIQVEGFPFLGNRNKISSKDTPLTYRLLKSLDGVAGKNVGH